MLSFDEHSGLISFLGGMVILVLVGVFLSMMVDHRFDFSKGNYALRQIIHEEEMTLTALKADTERSAELLHSRKTDHGGYDRLSQELISQAERIKSLKETQAALTGSIENIQRDMAQHRRKIWLAATGEKFPSLTIQGGREYLDVTIRQVTEAGLEIRHQDGLARIGFPDLDEAWHQRFRWQESERLKLLEQEIADFYGMGEAAKPVAAKKPSQSNNLETLRARVVMWRSRTAALESEYIEATSQGRRYRSVPQSLETWTRRAATISSKLAIANSELSRAEDRLRAVSPGDTLFQIPAVSQ